MPAALLDASYLDPVQAGIVACSFEKQRYSLRPIAECQQGNKRRGSSQESNLDADDPRANYMLQAGARLCKCLGNEFIPYLGVVMPSLLRSAQLKPDVNVADASSDDEDDDDDDEVSSARKQASPECMFCNLKLMADVGHLPQHLSCCQL